MARSPWRAAGALLAAACLASSAQADRVTVKGTTLEGTVRSMDSKTVKMKTVYGDGTLILKLADVSEIQTDGLFRVYHGEAVTEGAGSWSRATPSRWGPAPSRSPTSTP